MSETKTYTPAEMNEAKKLAEALVSVPENKRSIFTIMVESMLIGAELAEKQMAAASRPSA